MKSLKRNLIFLILLIFVINTTACNKVFEVKRIETNPATSKEGQGEKQNNSQIAEEPEKQKANALKNELETTDDEGNQSNKELVAENQDQVTNEELTDSKTEKLEEEKEIEKQEKEQEQEEEGQKQAQEASSEKIIKPGVFNYLFLTDKYSEEQPGGLKLSYEVGQDYFVHLLAEYYTDSSEKLLVNILWKDNQEKVVYKEEKLELIPNSNNLSHIHSVLGLSKKVPGQEIIPDALGDYWVIIEIEGEMVSKTKYSIVGNY